MLALPTRIWVSVPMSTSNAEQHQREGDEPLVESGELPDQGQADDAGRHQREERGDAA